MRYPSFLKEGGTIGLAAPSFGVSGTPYTERFESALNKFRQFGYNIKSCQHLYGIENGASADGRTRAEEFMQLYLDRDVDFISSVAGGELMCEILPYVDFEKLKEAEPKFFMGMSDNTYLTFTLPVFADTAAIYGSNFGSFGMEKWYKSLRQSYKIMTGQLLSQENYRRHEGPRRSDKLLDPLAGFHLNRKTVISSLDGQEGTMQGRLIGGCLDCLQLLAGTPYGQISDFLEKYRDDGFIWFMEACDLNVLAQKRALWQLKQAGWFRYCKGIMYGRPLSDSELFDVSLQKVLEEQLGPLNVPVIYGCDFGHVAPSWTIISGALGRVSFKDGSASIEYILK